MGGSGGGGGGYFPNKPAHVDSMVRRAQEQAAVDRNEAETNQQLLALLSRFNARDVEGTQERLAAVQECLGRGVEIDSILFGGSVAKHTYVDGLSDVDALVVIKDDHIQSPQDLRSSFKKLLEERLSFEGVKGIRQGDLATTIEYHDGTELQLLPARRTDSGVSIASQTGSGWSPIRPKAFAEVLSQINQSQSRAVVPTIKLAKSLISGMPAAQQLTGYHVEALAVEAFQGYDGRKTPVAMLRRLFEYAADRVRTPMSDPTGQSTHLDAYLGPAGSVERKLAADRMATVSRQLNSAASPERWVSMICGDEF